MAHDNPVISPVHEYFQNEPLSYVESHVLVLFLFSLSVIFHVLVLFLLANKNMFSNNACSFIPASWDWTFSLQLNWILILSILR